MFCVDCLFLYQSEYDDKSIMATHHGWHEDSAGTQHIWRHQFLKNNVLLFIIRYAHI